MSNTILYLYQERFRLTIAKLCELLRAYYKHKDMKEEKIERNKEEGDGKTKKRYENGFFVKTK